MVMEPHPERAAHTHNNRTVMGEGGLFTPAPSVCIRKHSLTHAQLSSRNEAANVFVTAESGRRGKFFSRVPVRVFVQKTE